MLTAFVWWLVLNGWDFSKQLVVLFLFNVIIHTYFYFYFHGLVFLYLDTFSVVNKLTPFYLLLLVDTKAYSKHWHAILYIS